MFAHVGLCLARLAHIDFLLQVHIGHRHVRTLRGRIEVPRQIRQPGLLDVNRAGQFGRIVANRVSRSQRLPTSCLNASLAAARPGVNDGPGVLLGPLYCMFSIRASISSSSK